MKLPLTILILLMFLPVRASEYLMRPLMLEHGLSQSTARCVLRDRKGYLWIGTDYGLNRYDNRTVTCYYADKEPGSIPCNFVKFLYLDGMGQVLVGSEHGLVRYDYENDKFIPITTADGQEISAYSALNTSSGTLIGSAGRLYNYDWETGGLQELPMAGCPDGPIMTILGSPRPGRYILMTYWQGVWVYDSASSTVNRLPFCHYDRVRGICFDNKRGLWVSPFTHGLECYDRYGNLIAKIDTSNSALSSNHVLDLKEFEDLIWIATERGIDLLNPETLEVVNLSRLAYGPNNCTVLCLSPDSNGCMYAGTLRHGVLCIYTVPMRTFTQFPGSKSFYGFTVLSVVPSGVDGKVWVGIDGEGVALFDPKEETFKTYDSTKELKVTSLMKYGDDELLVVPYCKDMQLLNIRTGQMRPVTGTLARVNEQAQANAASVEMLSFADGRIGVLTDYLFILDPKTGKVEKINPDASHHEGDKLKLCHNDGNTVVFFDNSYIYKYVSSDGSFNIIYSNSDEDNIKCVAYRDSATVIVGSEDGLIRHNLNTNQTDTLKSSYLRNINSLIYEGDRLWIGVDSRICMYHEGSLTVFDANDGVQPNQFLNQAQLLMDDYLLIGGVNGLLKINRSEVDSLMAKPIVSELSLSNLLVDNVRVAVKDGVARIPSKHAVITVQIIDNDNMGMRNKLFRYQVVGRGRNIEVETFDRAFALNTLPSGRYRVYASYNMSDGSWSEPVEMVEIDVAVPRWRSWWAMLLYAVIATGALGTYLMMLRVRQLRKMDELRQNTLQDKIDFLTKLNDDLRNPLTLIISPLRNLLDARRDGIAEGDDTPQLEEIYINSLQMRDIIDTLPEMHRLEGYIQPLNKPDKPDEIDETQAKPKTPGIAENYDATPYTALLVEENAKLSAFLLSELESIFKSVLVLDDVGDAMRVVKDRLPDIVIIDVELKDDSGFDLCHTIKSTESLRHIPVILLTQGNADSEMRKIYACGADGYLSKPFDVNLLTSRCKNVLLNRDNMRQRYDRKTADEDFVAVNNSDESFLIELDAIISENISQTDLNVDFLIKKFAMGRNSFYNKLRNITGKSVVQYIADFRLEQAKKLLANPALSIAEIAERLGFGSQSYFGKFMKTRTGMTPREYRMQCTGKTDDKADEK